MNLDYGKNNIEEVPFSQYLEQFKEMDPAAASERTGIPYDADRGCFRMRMLQKEYEIKWPQCEVICVTKDSYEYEPMAVQTDAKIFAIRFLLHGVKSEASGEFKTFREFKGGDLYFKPFQGRCLMRLAFGYGFKLDKFAEAMEKMGAKKCSFADVSYEFEFINGYFVRFMLWAGDDEFQPSSQIVFSDNFPLSFETYDLAVVGDISITTLKKIN